jgi:hypothetical protein
MRIGMLSSIRPLALLALLAAGCSSGSDSSIITLTAALQDLGAAADGTTTVLTFSDDPGTVSLGMVSSDGAQNALSIGGTGSVRTVTWDNRVSPMAQVRVVGNPEVSTAYRAVTTSDASAPTFLVTTATQDTSDALLGGDTFTLTFTGPRVVEALAEDVTNWTLESGGETLDLTGAVFDLVPATQVLTGTLAAGANLHASFDLTPANLVSVSDTAVANTAVTGAATGDALDPAVISVQQRLALDPNGSIVDFVFNEPMDPISSPRIGRFLANDHVNAIGLTLTAGVTQVDAVTLRVTFSKPIVPGLDTVDLLGLMDAHGNLLGNVNVAIGNAEASANAFTSVTAITTSNSGGDQIVIITDQALDPDLAIDPARWTVLVQAVPVTMANQALSYDLVTRTLTVDLDFDMNNGDTIDVTSVSQVDIDGDAFGVAAAQVNASGDAVAPTASAAVQQRTADPSGQTVDVTFSEDLDPATAQDVNNYDIGPGFGTNISSATVLPDGNTVRVVTTTVMTPGMVNISCDNDIEDLAGTATGVVIGPITLTSTDVEAPAISTITVLVTAGADNDTLSVSFSDDMISAEVEALANWNFESPVGTPWALAAETVSYDPVTRLVALRLDNGNQFLRVGDTFQLGFTTMRDIGANTIDATVASGNVTGESDSPRAHVAWRDDAPNDDQIIVRFDEPCGPYNNLYHPINNAFGTQFFAVRNSVGTLRGHPTSAVIVDGGLGVRVGFGFVIALTDTIDVAGLTDLAGNVMFESVDMPILGSNATAPIQAALPVHTAVTGESGDSVVVTFNRPMSPWQVTNPDLYNLQTFPGGVVIDLSGATFNWDGSMTLTIGLNNSDLVGSETYRLGLLNNVDPLRTETGIALVGIDNQDNTVVGDTVNGPTQGGSAAFIDSAVADSVIVIFDEAVDQALAEVPANYDLNGGNLATTVTRVSPRVVRATFAVTPVAAQNLVIDQASSVDVAGNMAAGAITLAIGTDGSAPLLNSVTATSVSGLGDDTIQIEFTEQLDLVSALEGTNYTVTNGISLPLTNATFSWDSTTATVTIHLPDGMNINVNQALSVSVNGVMDASGNAIGTPVALGAVITGDSTAPTVAKSFVNFDADPFGGAVDILFDEAVSMAFGANIANWTFTGVGAITSVTQIASDHIRIQVAATVSGGDTLDLASGLTDLAGNPTVATMIVDPFDGLE